MHNEEMAAVFAVFLAHTVVSILWVLPLAQG